MTSNVFVLNHGSQQYRPSEQISNLNQQPGGAVAFLNPAAPPRSFEGMAGESEDLMDMLAQIKLVGPTSTTVLVEGETGTGKELVARALHRLSARAAKPFVQMNCAAIPASLLRVELFGHEKGAFTGALMRRVGRFESAHGGTIFLDEIGDMPLELQAKLLRVLQEREVERLGSTQTVKVDVRVIAATNQDLAQLVREKKFRADLFYRLNVFPISVPPLRRRAGDIPLLAEHFIRVFNERMNKHIKGIPVEALEALTRHAWPGNIRELQNVIERSMVRTQGDILRLSGPAAAAAAVERPEPLTLEDAQRQHILKALSVTNWVVGGSKGAAVRLGMKRTTLIHTMGRLGIKQKARFCVAKA